MGLANSFDIAVNFWKVNPQLASFGGFKELYDSDDSKDKVSSSKIMWAIAFMYDPDSKFINIPTEKRMDIIKIDFLKDKKFDWSKYDNQIKMYLDCILTPAERLMSEWKNKLEERSKFIKEQKYTLENAKDLDRMLADTKKMYDYYNSVLDDLIKEKSGSRVKGNTMESAAEKGLI